MALFNTGKFYNRLAEWNFRIIGLQIDRRFRVRQIVNSNFNVTSSARKDIQEHK
jgi:hypothetical protein